MRSPLIRSLRSAIAGQLACIVALFFLHPTAFFMAPLGVPVLVCLYSGPLFLVVWLLLLWPLYRLVPRSSLLWRPYVCVPCGTAAGVLLVALWVRMVSGEWDFQRFIYWGFGPLAGAVTCATGCALKAAEPMPAQLAAVPSIRQRAVWQFRRLSRWFEGRFAEWSDQ